LCTDHLDLVRIGIEAELADGDLLDGVVGALEGVEVLLARFVQQAVRRTLFRGGGHRHLRLPCGSWRTAGGRPERCRPWKTPAASRSSPGHRPRICSRARGRWRWP